MHFWNLGDIKWVFIFHVIGGASALAALSIPLLSKKGGKLHVRAGLFYTYAMILVGVSALTITPWRIFFDEARTQNSRAFSTFLFFISIFTLSALWTGIAALKEKVRKGPSHKLKHLGPPILTILCGLGAQAIGYRIHNTLLMIFPFLGHLTAMNQLKYWLRTPDRKMHWWYAHMDGMFTACIATITAFLVTAVPRIWPMPIFQSPLLWIAPGVILGTVLSRWQTFYQQKFGDTVPINVRA